MIHLVGIAPKHKGRAIEDRLAVSVARRSRHQPPLFGRHWQRPPRQRGHVEEERVSWIRRIFLLTVRDYQAARVRTEAHQNPPARRRARDSRGRIELPPSSRRNVI